jgi:flagellar hook assembly protein FlgD
VLGESPLGGGIALLVDLPENLQGRLELFDIGGRRVREFAAGVLPKGATVQLWDGRDEAGARAGAGIYFAKLTTPGAARVVRVVLASAAR